MMPLFLPALIAKGSKPPHHFVLLESSISQSSFPVFKAILNEDGKENLVLLLCFLYPPSTILDNDTESRFTIIDKTSCIPGYCRDSDDLTNALKLAIESGTVLPAWYLALGQL